MWRPADAGCWCALTSTPRWPTERWPTTFAFGLRWGRSAGSVPRGRGWRCAVTWDGRRGAIPLSAWRRWPGGWRSWAGSRCVICRRWLGSRAAEAIGRGRPGEVFLLENTRFDPGETADAPELADRLAGVGRPVLPGRLRLGAPRPRLHGGGCRAGEVGGRPALGGRTPGDGKPARRSAPSLRGDSGRRQGVRQAGGAVGPGGVLRRAGDRRRHGVHGAGGPGARGGA